MKKKLLIPLLAGGVLLGTAGVIPVFALDGGINLGDASTNTDSSTYDSIRSKDQRELTADISASDSDSEEITSPSNIEMNQIRGERDRESLDLLATQYGISREGKSEETFIEDLKSAMIVSKAKELGISTEGKDLDAILGELKTIAIQKGQQEVENQSSIEIDRDALRGEEHKEKLNQLAKEFSITLEGKSNNEVKKELQHAMIISKAKELGVSIAGKDLDTIITEIKSLVEKNN